MSDEQILYDPTAEPRILASGLAPRLASLEGKRGGHPRQQQGQRGHPDAGGDRAPQGEVRRPRRRQAREGIAGAPSPDILAALTTCDFVLVGSAD